MKILMALTLLLTLPPGDTWSLAVMEMATEPLYCVSNRMKGSVMTCTPFCLQFEETPENHKSCGHVKHRGLMLTSWPKCDADCRAPILKAFKMREVACEEPRI